MDTQISETLWRSLPGELQGMIATQVVEEEHGEDKTVAGYATVSKAWQVIVERITMRELRFSKDELITFEQLFLDVRRRRYIRYIGLEFLFIDSVESVDNSVWTASICDRNLARLHRELNRQTTNAEDNAAWNTKRINYEVTNMIYWFISLTSRWERSEVSHDGICLELIAETKSYCQELACRFVEYDGDVLDNSYLNTIDEDYRAFLYRSASRDFDRQAEWDHTWQVDLDALGLPCNTFESLTADFISGISLNYDNVRYISPYVVNKLAKQLSSIEYIDWQYKARFCSTEKHDKLIDDHIAAVAQLPATIKSLCLRQVGLGQFWGAQGNQQTYESHKRGDLAAALAALAARQLEKLTVTCVIDALDFFKMAGPNTMWPMLKHLALTTSCLDDKEPTSFESPRAHQIQRVIRKAGEAALRMPQLDFFSLTNGNPDGGVDVFFSFQVHEYEPHEFEPSFAMVKVFADQRNEHATNDVLTRLSLKKWHEVAASRSLDLTMKVGFGGDTEQHWHWSLMGGMAGVDRLQYPVVRQRG